MPRIDLDAARAARREATSETPTVIFGGREFALPEELPFGVFVSLAEMRENPTNAQATGAVESLLRTLFGERTDEFIDLGPSLDDVQTLIEAALDEYGLGDDEDAEPDAPGADGLGESSASPE